MGSFRHILVPTDGSERALAGARQAVALAKDVGAKVTFLFVSPPWEPPYSDISSSVATYEAARSVFEEQSVLAAKKSLAEAQALAAQAGVACEALTEEDGTPWQRIIDTASGRGCDLIVMGSHGRGYVGQLLLGSQTTQVLTRSKIPVLVCR